MTDREMAEKYVTKNANHILDTNNAFISSHEAFLEGLKAGRDLAATDLATVAYMQGADNRKKKSEAQLIKAREVITALLDVFVYDLADDELDSGDIDVRTKAEEFLKEVEK